MHVILNDIAFKSHMSTFLLCVSHFDCRQLCKYNSTACNQTIIWHHEFSAVPLNKHISFPRISSQTQKSSCNSTENSYSFITVMLFQYAYFILFSLQFNSFFSDIFLNSQIKMNIYICVHGY